ncbi:MAG: MATE family efflux transporter [Deltaproteobacteria bacterium]
MIQKDLTEGKVSKQILEFAVPMLLGNIFQQLYNIVDSIVVGKFLGNTALAAVGASFPIIFLLISLGFGVTMGGTISISHFFGAGQKENVRKTVDTMNIFILFVSIAFAIIGIVFSDGIFRLISLPEEVIPMASEYLVIYMYGLPFFFGFVNISATLRGVGDSKTPLYLLIFSTVINIILDLVFVLVFKMGVGSVALATIISQAIAYFAALYLMRKDEMLRFQLKKITFDWPIFNKSIKIGIPSGIQHVLFSLGMMAIFAIVNKFGVKVIAAYSGAMRLDSLAVIPAMNLSNALSTFVGQNMGAGKISRIKEGLNITLKVSVIISLAITILFYFFGTDFMKMFTDDPQVAFYGNEYLVISSAFYIVFSGLFCYSAVMRGAGDVMIPMFITIISLWLIRIPFAYFLAPYMAENAVWWSAPAGWTVGLIMTYFYYKTGRWHQRFKLL